MKKNRELKGSISFLGTGGSMGTPLIGCQCETCLSSNPKNKRLRSSLLIEVEEEKYVIDVGPDFRQQALYHNIDRLDGIFITHAHQDHVGGLDELRVYSFLQNKKIPVLFSKETYQDLLKRFYYIFEVHPLKLISKVEPVLLPEEEGEFTFGPFEGRYFSYYQSGMKVNGFRMGDLAYVTDIKHPSEEIYKVLRGVKILILSCLRHEPSEMHLSLEEAVAFGKKVEATKTYLIHISHEMSVEKGEKELPTGIELAYDGLKILDIAF